MSEDLSGRPVAPRVPRPDEIVFTPLVSPPAMEGLERAFGPKLNEVFGIKSDRHENAAGKKLCGACQAKVKGEWRCRLVKKCPPYGSLPCPVPVPAAGCPSFLKKISAPRPPQLKKKGSPVPPGVKFLYLGKPKGGAHAHIGVVTIAWTESSPGVLHLGFSFCSPKDPWCKATGRDMAVARLKNFYLTVPYLYDAKRTAREIARAIMSHDFGRLAAITPGTTMWDRVPSWTKGLVRAMEARRKSVVHVRLKPITIRGGFIKATPGSPIDWARSLKPKPTSGEIMTRMLRDIAALGND